MKAQRDEELLWRQKSRITWLRTPDLNTRFFHLLTIIRRRRNNIDAIIDADGTWLSNRHGIGCRINSYFQQLYTAQQPRFPLGLEGLIPSVINDEDNQILCSPPLDEEIWVAVRGIGSQKAPGPRWIYRLILPKILGSG